jgi:hypothetical protein
MEPGYDLSTHVSSTSTTSPLRSPSGSVTTCSQVSLLSTCN